MANYYTQALRANKYIDNEIKTLLNKQIKEINIAHLSLRVTGNFEIGEKTIIKRVNNWVEAYPDNLRIKNGLLVFEEGEQ